MKKILAICIMAMFGLSACSQSATEVDNLKQQQKVLNLTAKLNKLEIKYAKEQANYANKRQSLYCQRFGQCYDGRIQHI